MPFDEGIAMRYWLLLLLFVMSATTLSVSPTLACKPAPGSSTAVCSDKLKVKTEKLPKPGWELALYRLPAGSSIWETVIRFTAASGEWNKVGEACRLLAGVYEARDSERYTCSSSIPPAIGNGALNPTVPAPVGPAAPGPKLCDDPPGFHVFHLDCM